MKPPNIFHTKCFSLLLIHFQIPPNQQNIQAQRYPSHYPIILMDWVALLRNMKGISIFGLIVRRKFGMFPAALWESPYNRTSFSSKFISFCIIMIPKCAVVNISHSEVAWYKCLRVSHLLFAKLFSTNLSENYLVFAKLFCILTPVK